MNIEHMQDFKLDDFTLISSLPDMGKVGGLVSQHIAKKLNVQIAAKITVSDKPWINQKKGLIEVPCDEYRLSVDVKNKIVIFEGESQPQEAHTVMRLADRVFLEVQKIGNVSRVISAGGYLPAVQNKTAKVFAVATDHKILEQLQKHQIYALDSDVNSITWFNGLILAKAKENNIDGIGLFGEIINSNTPQYKAASQIIQKIEKILNVVIGTQEIDAQVIEQPIEKISIDGPGIG